MQHIKSKRLMVNSATMSNRRDKSYDSDGPIPDPFHRQQAVVRVPIVDAFDGSELDRGRNVAMQQRSSLTRNVDLLRPSQAHDPLLLRRIEEEKRSIRLRIAVLEAHQRSIIEEISRRNSIRSMGTLVASPRDTEDFLSDSSWISARIRSLQERATARGLLSVSIGPSSRNVDDILHGHMGDSAQQRDVSLRSMAGQSILPPLTGMTDGTSDCDVATRDETRIPRGSMLMNNCARRPKRTYTGGSTSSGPEEGKPRPLMKRANIHRDDQAQPKAGIALSLPPDSGLLSPYQALLRQSLEFFEASETDIQTSQKGRKRRIQLGQVGIRCRFCAHIHPSLQTNGASTFPRTKESIYMCAQNIAMAHMVVPEGRRRDVCRSMPPNIHTALVKQKAIKSPSAAGACYWAREGCACNLREENGALWLT